MKKSITIIIALISVTFSLFAFNHDSHIEGKLSGFIFDNQTDLPIPDANIVITNTSFGTASQAGGYYHIEKIPTGVYDVTVRVIGYKTEIIEEIRITSNTVLDFRLTPQAIQVDPILVTATRSEHLQSKITVSAEVLTPPRIKEQTGNTVGEITESIGGLYTRSYDGFAGPQMPSIRGSNPDQVLILMDGIRLNTAQGGGVDLNAFPVNAFERIEVVRGGHSALLGSDAMGGTIHLISRYSMGPKGFAYSIQSTMGSFGMKNYNVYGSHRIGSFSLFANYSRTQSQGDFTYIPPDANTQTKRKNNDFEGDNLLVKSTINLAMKHRFQLLYHSFATDRGVSGPVFQGFDTPLARRTENRKLYSLQSEHILTDRFSIKAQASYQIYNHHFLNPTWFVDDLHKNESGGMNIQGQYYIDKHLHILAGAEIRRDRLKSTKFNADDRNLQSLFIQSETRHSFPILGILMNWTIIPALRWDSYSDVDSHVSPKLGAMISMGEINKISFRSNIGQSFRVPTLDDLYWPEESWGEGFGGATGNPNLKPETAYNYDVGVTFSQASDIFIKLDMTYFQNDVKNLIDWQMDENSWYKPVNIGKAKVIGTESLFEVRLPNDRAHFSVSHTWMKASDESPDSPNKGSRLTYRPEHKFDVSAGITIGPVQMNLNYRIVGKRFTQPGNSQSLPEYRLLNGNIGATLPIGNLNIEAKLQALNLLDKSIYLLDGYPLPGREFRLTLGFHY